MHSWVLQSATPVIDLHMWVAFVELFLHFGRFAVGPGLSGQMQILKLSHSLKVAGRRRNTPKSAQNRCVPVCGYRAGYFGFGPALCPHSVRNRRFPAGSLKCSGSFWLGREEHREQTWMPGSLIHTTTRRPIGRRKLPARGEPYLRS